MLNKSKLKYSYNKNVKLCSIHHKIYKNICKEVLARTYQPEEVMLQENFDCIVLHDFVVFWYEVFWVSIIAHSKNSIYKDMNKQRLIRISHYQNHLYCMLYFTWVCDQTLSLLILFLAINTNLFCRTPPPPKHIQQKTYFCNKRFIYASQYTYVKNYAGEILFRWQH